MQALQAIVAGLQQPRQKQIAVVRGPSGEIAGARVLEQPQAPMPQPQMQGPA